MEGIGYWLFLLVLYLLSMLMKKRQREAARSRLEKGESAGEKIKKPVRSDFLKELFGEELPFVDEYVQAEKEPLDIETLSTEPESSVPDIEPVRETITVDYRPVPKKKIDMITHRRYMDVKPRTYGRHPFAGILKSFVNSPDHLKQAIVLKEILDKPRALRRAIR
ncbi:MAG: hypothetical protein GXO92_03230 [FCB group bacterium]|nr:hypothetical protein [FCB group bacterium]